MNYFTFFLLVAIGIALLVSPVFDENVEQGAAPPPVYNVAHNKAP